MACAKTRYGVTFKLARPSGGAVDSVKFFKTKAAAQKFAKSRSGKTKIKKWCFA